MERTVEITKSIEEDGSKGSRVSAQELIKNDNWGPLTQNQRGTGEKTGDEK